MSEWTESLSGFHEPVLVREVMELLAPAGDGVYLDGTVGGGGHARILLEGCASCRAPRRGTVARAEPHPPRPRRSRRVAATVRSAPADSA